jgi:hypothetical protein
MSNDNTRDAPEPSPASAGSQVVAWEVMLPGVGTYDILSFQWEADAIAAGLREREGTKALALPLYRQPQPTLTDEEREAIERSIRYWRGGFRPHPFATVLSQLLRRLQQLK